MRCALGACPLMLRCKLDIGTLRPTEGSFGRREALDPLQQPYEHPTGIDSFACALRKLPGPLVIGWQVRQTRSMVPPGGTDGGMWGLISCAPALFVQKGGGCHAFSRQDSVLVRSAPISGERGVGWAHVVWATNKDKGARSDEHGIKSSMRRGQAPEFMGWRGRTAGEGAYDKCVDNRASMFTCSIATTYIFDPFSSGPFSGEFDSGPEAPIRLPRLGNGYLGRQVGRCLRSGNGPGCVTARPLSVGSPRPRA